MTVLPQMRVWWLALCALGLVVVLWACYRSRKPRRQRKQVRFADRVEVFPAGGRKLDRKNPELREMVVRNRHQLHQERLRAMAEAFTLSE